MARTKTNNSGGTSAEQINFSGNLAVLPSVNTNKGYSVLDELGVASVATPIVISPQNGETINGMASVSITSPHGGAEFWPNSKVANEWYIK